MKRPSHLIAVFLVAGSAAWLFTTAFAGDLNPPAGPIVDQPVPRDALFGDAVHYAAGDGPASVAIGDLDGDEVLDLAVANNSSDDVSVLLGVGDGSFAPAQHYAAGNGYSAPQSVAIGDLDADEVPDLVVANSNSNDVSVLLGLGDGTFAPAQHYAAGNGYIAPQSVAIGDLDGDQVPDLAVANSHVDNVSVLLGLGDGSFAAAQHYASDDAPCSVAIGDLDGDQVPDLAVANRFSDDVSVLLGLGDGTFATAQYYSAGDVPQSVAIGDLDGDEVLDLAVANISSDDVSVLLGVGDGSFAPAQHYAAGNSPQSVAIGDLDGDQVPDLAVALYSSDNVSVLLGLGDGTFASGQWYAAGNGPRSVAMGDLNGDRVPDLAAANYWSDDVSVLLNQTAPPASTWYVDDDGANDPGPGDPLISDPAEDGSPDHPYDAIQEAIDAAADGDEVVIADGTYTGLGNKNLDFAGQAITVRSASGDPTTCVVDCEGDGRGFYFHSGEGGASVVSGLTIANGHATSATPGGDDGGAILCTSGSGPQLTACIVSGNTADDLGGGLCANGSSMHVTGCTFIGNSANNGGGARFDAVAAQVAECVFSDNAAQFGGALNFVGAQDVLVERCEFRDNVASSSGGGVLVNVPGGTSIQIVGSIFASNQAMPGTSWGGGGLLAFTGDVTLVNCLLSDNVGAPYGGGVYVQQDNTTLNMLNCTLSGNFSPPGGGGGIFIWALAEPAVLTNCLLWGNLGGGSDESAQITISNDTVNASYCCIQGLDTLAGNNNIGDDPLFVRTPFGDLDDLGDTHLACGSPCIDAGTLGTDPPLPATDLDGQVRVMNGFVDIGAYEGGHQAVIAQPSPISVPEGGTSVLDVSLACDPEGSVEVVIAPESGDADIQIESGSSLWFDSSNYANPQPVTLGAAQDPDLLAGQATFTLAQGSAFNRILAIEEDDDTPPNPRSLLVASSYSNSVVLKDGPTGTISEFVASNGAVTRPWIMTSGPDGHLYVTDFEQDTVQRYDGQTGAWLGTFVTAGSGGLVAPWGLIFGSDGHLYVANWFGNGVLRYDGATGMFLDVFIPGGSGGLDGPSGLAYGADGHLYVTSSWTDEVLRYDGTSGAFLDVFVSAGSGGLEGPGQLAFGPDGNLYVCSANTNEILRYDGTTGSFIDDFVPAGSGGLVVPSGLRFGPGGSLYVSSYDDRVLLYDGATGAFIGEFVSAGSGGLDEPRTLLFGLDDDLLVVSSLSRQILRYDGATGDFIGIFAGGGSGGLVNTRGLAYGPDDNLYVTSDLSDAVLRYDGRTGAFIDAFVPTGAGGLDGPRGLAFAPDGNLYVASSVTASILRYDGQTGAFINEFVQSGAGGLQSPQDLLFHTDGFLYVSDFGADCIHRYDAQSGAYVDDFIPTGSGGLDRAIGFVIGPDDNWYLTSSGTHSVLRYGPDGAFIDEFVTPYSGGLGNPTSLLFDENGYLYVSSWGQNSVLRYVGPDGSANEGAFVDEYIPAGSAGLAEPQRLCWMPDDALGDLDCDGDVDFDDISPFVLALSGQAGYEAQFPDCHWLNADCDEDGDVDFDDISPFVSLIGG